MNYLYAKVDEKYQLAFQITDDLEKKRMFDEKAVEKLKAVRDLGDNDWKAFIDNQIGLIFQLKEVSYV